MIQPNSEAINTSFNQVNLINNSGITNPYQIGRVLPVGASSMPPPPPPQTFPQQIVEKIEPQEEIIAPTPLQIDSTILALYRRYRPENFILVMTICLLVLLVVDFILIFVSYYSKLLNYAYIFTGPDALAFAIIIPDFISVFTNNDVLVYFSVCSHFVGDMIAFIILATRLTVILVAVKVSQNSQIFYQYNFDVIQNSMTPTYQKYNYPIDGLVFGCVISGLLFIFSIGVYCITQSGISEARGSRNQVIPQNEKKLFSKSDKETQDFKKSKIVMKKANNEENTSPNPRFPEMNDINPQNNAAGSRQIKQFI